MRIPQSCLIAGLVLATMITPAVHATGVAPETSVVIVNEADGEGTMVIKNTDSTPTLLYTTLEDIPEDNAALLVVTPPVARIEPGQTQLVRFVLNTTEPLKVARLKRVIFEGIPQTDKTKSKVQLSVRQNLPVVIQPAGVPVEREPWTQLQWSITGDTLTVKNPSPYVVRLSQAVQLLPGAAHATLPATYVLPGASHSVSLENAGSADRYEQVRISPATVYGYQVDTYDAKLATSVQPAQ
ncbi:MULTISPECIES: fimbria/pilus chaperone family protein [Paraburkholderia]|uniref:fimbria/pilus chaperone family protein n=1 Tax=Paraburkholderia TaxID=1822464 RepID=UPI002255C31C|nr:MULTISPECIES: fimbria/pilus chaperone family protein [Paraburkholderia]MCX4163084.1 fimbria/pilus chaperone family protein [Paraburkholderia megapolitana]MDN7158580.1 fimbria/pilus chaperone family protein [Paraburkholderia sp. CHISQ3]MDQ6495627.1 fimbria/pilus chaperone family protein [Paraburkholderia megapolitana]